MPNLVIDFDKIEYWFFTTQFYTSYLTPYKIQLGLMCVEFEEEKKTNRKTKLYSNDEYDVGVSFGCQKKSIF